MHIISFVMYLWAVPGFLIPDAFMWFYSITNAVLTRQTSASDRLTLPVPTLCSHAHAGPLQLSLVFFGTQATHGFHIVFIMADRLSWHNVFSVVVVDLKHDWSWTEWCWELS